jgi:DNA-binding transcriptional LysR family regulator
MSLSASALLNRLQSRLKVRHVQALLVVYDLRNMGRAAEAMGISQPAMSQIVSDIENLIEAKLFLRHSRGVEPTQAMLDLLPVARRIISATEEGAERIATRLRRESGMVRVGSTAATTGAILDEMLGDFATANPGVLVQATSLLGAALDAAFAGDEFDVICSRERSVVPEGWVFQPYCDDRLVVICSYKHPFAHANEVSLEDLSQAIWVQNHVATIARQKFDDFVEQAGWSGLKERHVNTRASVLIWSTLRNGDCVTLVPRSVVGPWLREGTICEIRSPLELELAPLGYHWRPELAGPATLGFVRALDANSPFQTQEKP